MSCKHRIPIALTALAAGLSLNLPGVARADRDDFQFSVAKVDSYLQSQMQQRHIPGLTVAITWNGQLAAARSYGLANVEVGAPTHPSSVYQVGTITQPFTAAAVMMLVEEGKVKLNQSVTHFLPNPSEVWDAVTVRHLLTQTSGIPNYLGILTPGTTSHQAVSKQAIMNVIAKQRLQFSPGQKFQFSPSNYFLLGMIIEKASGESYSRFLSERIFEPLHMSKTRVNDLGEVIPNRVAGYSLMDGELLQNATIPSPTRYFATGSLVSTVTDLAKWEAALNTEKLLKRASLEQMWTPAKLRDGTVTQYGFGWWIHSLPGGATLIEHGGNLPGFNTQIARYVNDKVTVILFTNVDAANPLSLADGVHRIVAPGVPVRAQ
jgi:D-alanyl-D-alanine carboxypeptidase